MYNTIIIGGGAAGLSAAVYSARYKMKALLVAKMIGGSFSEAHKIENWLGTKSATGIELAERFEEHARSYDIKIVDAEVISIKKTKKGFEVLTKDNKYETETVILATGMRHRQLDIPGEEKFLGKGISYCFTCDSPLYQDKVVAVIGGADSACTGAILLAEYAKKVYLIYRKSEIRAEPITVDKIKKNKKIEVLYNTEVKEAKGNKFLGSILLNNNKELKVDGLFIEIGHVPVTALAKEFKLKTEDGFIIVDDMNMTSQKGIFAAGDIVFNNKVKQIVTAAAGGAVAAVGAFKYTQKK